MRLEWIEDILAVSEMGSFNTAAEARFLTPSAFTRRIRTIEETLGCELFDRTKKPIILKPHVRDMLPDLRKAAADLRRVRRLLSEPGSGPEPTYHTDLPARAHGFGCAATSDAFNSGKPTQCAHQVGPEKRMLACHHETAGRIRLGV